MCSSPLLWRWNTALELEMQHVNVPHTILFKVVCCSGGPGGFGFALKDCRFCASKYHLLLNLCCPLLIGRIMRKPGNQDLPYWFIPISIPSMPMFFFHCC